MASTISIDKAGRLVVPRKYREALGISGESELEVEQEGNALVIRPKAAAARAIQKQGVWVFETDGGPITQEMINDVLRRGRAEREKRVVGE